MYRDALFSKLLTPIQSKMHYALNYVWLEFSVRKADATPFAIAINGLIK